MRKLSVLAAGLVGGVGSAMAAVPTEVSAAISSSGADAATVAGAVFVAIVGIFAIKLMRKGL